MAARRLLVIKGSRNVWSSNMATREIQNYVTTQRGQKQAVCVIDLKAVLIISVSTFDIGARSSQMWTLSYFLHFMQKGSVSPLFDLFNPNA